MSKTKPLVREKSSKKKSKKTVMEMVHDFDGVPDKLAVTDPKQKEGSRQYKWVREDKLAATLSGPLKAKTVPFSDVKKRGMHIPVYTEKDGLIRNGDLVLVKFSSKRKQAYRKSVELKTEGYQQSVRDQAVDRLQTVGADVHHGASADEIQDAFSRRNHSKKTMGVGNPRVPSPNLRKRR